MFKTSLDYTVTPRPALATSETLSQNKQYEKRAGDIAHWQSPCLDYMMRLYVQFLTSPENQNQNKAPNTIVLLV